MSSADRLSDTSAGFAGLPIGWAFAWRALALCGLSAAAFQLAGWPAALSVSVLGASALAWWAQRRYHRALEQLCEVADRVQHGRSDAQIEASDGAPEIRRVAGAMSALIREAAEQRRAGRATVEAEIQAAAAALRGLGEGDLEQQAPRLERPFAPLSDAIDDARAALQARVRRLSELSGEVAIGLSQLAPAVSKLRVLFGESQGALSELDRSLGAAVEAMGPAHEAMEEAVEQMFLVTAERRLRSKEARAAVPRIAGRAEDLAAQAAKLGDLLREAGVMEQALGLLTEQSHGGDPPRPERVIPILREARAAQNSLRAGLAEVEATLRRLSGALTQAARELPEPSPALEAELSVPLFEVAAISRRGMEACEAALNVLSASARESEKAVGALGRVEDAERLQRGLTEAYTALRLGAQGTQDVLQVLERAAEEARALAPGTLSPPMQEVLQQLDAQAGRAHAKIGGLADATERALRLLS